MAIKYGFLSKISKIANDIESMLRGFGDHSAEVALVVRFYPRLVFRRALGSFFSPTLDRRALGLVKISRYSQGNKWRCLKLMTPSRWFFTSGVDGRPKTRKQPDRLMAEQERFLNSLKESVPTFSNSAALAPNGSGYISGCCAMAALKTNLI
jgi:hypothetical protein